MVGNANTPENIFNGNKPLKIISAIFRFRTKKKHSFCVQYSRAHLLFRIGNF